MTVCRSFKVLVFTLGMTQATLISAQQVATAPVSTDDVKAAQALLTRPVTVKFNRTPLATAIDVIIARAGLTVVYKRELTLASPKMVTLRAEDVPCGAIIERVLEGTGLQLNPLPEAQFSLTVRDAHARYAQAMTGGVSGLVVDAKTKKPIRGATVTIDGMDGAVRTGDGGTFRIGNVVAGTHRIVVRRLGYQVYTSSVTVTDEGSVTLRIVLTPAIARLAEMVTTAIGQQRRLEVGNAISHLNVDSIGHTAPVTNLTDLLSARAPGVQVIEGTGLVGSGPTIRIRGTSSLTVASDPIVIVDGVRQDNTSGAVYSKVFGGSVPSASRLNDLDFTQIETIDILKGPAASTEYGTDAANGVIVITTKHGKSGAPQWHASTERGWSDVPVGFPDLYYAWGHTTDGSRTPTQCPVLPWYSTSVDDGTCVQDSVKHDNPLNHSGTTIYGHGLREKGAIEVSGGSDAVRYYIGGNASHDVGTVKTPDVFRARAIAAGFPSSVLDPNAQQQQSVRANVAARVTHAIDMTANGAYMSTQTRAPASVVAFPTPFGATSVVDSANNYGYGFSLSSTPLYSLGQTQFGNTKRATAGLTTDWRPATWLSGRAIVGLDHGSSQQESLILPQALAFAYGQNDNGSLAITNATTDISTVDLRGSTRLSVSAIVQSTTSAGLQVVGTKTQGVQASVIGNLPQANQTINGVPNPAVAQQIDESGTVGGYLEEQVAVADRLFLTGALRLDAASGFGGDYHKTVYPKASASWLVLNTGATTLRLRTAFGIAGVQPPNGAALQLYNASVVYLNGGQTSASSLGPIGNPNLRPERSQEFEGGVDVGLFGDRVTLEVTHYVKHTKDALVTTTLGWDLGGATVEENLGDVRNRGLETTVQATLVRAHAVTWDATFNASSNHNVLLRLAQGATTQSIAQGYQRNAVGYPLNGFWGKAATYADANADGIITPNEVTVANTATYVGSSVPSFEGSYATNVGLFHGALTASALFDYRHGGLMLDYKPLAAARYGGYLRAQNDSSAPLRDQAQILADLRAGSTSLDFRDASFVRFRELSLTYALPTRWIRGARVQNVSVTAAVRNLKLWTSYPGNDPETSSPGSAGVTGQFYSGGPVVNNDVRVDFGGAVPLPRTWVVRLNAGF